MPLPLLLAIVLAFGLRLPSDDRPLSNSELTRRLIEAGLGVLALGVVAGTLGITVRILSRRSSRSSLARSLHGWGSRLLLLLSLTVFGWTLSTLDWPRVVAWGMNLRGVPLVEQVAILTPFLAGQFVIWAGLYFSESSLRLAVADQGLASYVIRRARQSFGMIVPVALLYYVSREIVQRGLPSALENPAVQLLISALAGLAIFVLSPAFVRMSWPTRRLPDGPLRARLERLSKRLGFRYTEILIWDTNGLIVNAGVTGAVPWFRYVLITDALIDVLDDDEIEAVFGHEVGHIAHWHLPYFAAFCLGSIGFLTLASEGLARFWDYESAIERLFPDPMVAEIVQAMIAVGILGLYFYVVFGMLSRRFERQADVYGSRAVSCGRSDCPPHQDPNDLGAPKVPLGNVCPEGVHLFVNALSRVAAINGMNPSSRSWRHGSIAQRIDFVLSLEHRPQSERQFDKSVLRLKWWVGMILGAGTLAALALFAI